MNYLFTKLCLGFFSGKHGINAEAVSGTGLTSIDPLDAEAFKSGVEWLLSLYPWEATLAQLNLLDSHDTARYLTIANGDVSSLELAYFCQMTFPGAPCIYYGDEIGMAGGDPVEAARAGMVWDTSEWNMQLLEHLKRCIALRREHEVLRRGSLRTLFAGGELYVFSRELEGQIAIVAINAADGEVTVELDLPDALREMSGTSSWRGLPFSCQDGRLEGWTVGGRSGDVLLGERGL
jgi:neopullulanase